MTRYALGKEEKIMSEKKVTKPDEVLKSADRSGSALHINRRNFLKLAALGGAGLIASPGKSEAVPEFSGWPDSYGMLTDFTACVGCRSCERACNQQNKMPEPDKPFDDPSVFEEERWPSANALTVVNRYRNTAEPDRPLYRKVQCNHCLEPACASACPLHAYTKTPEGAVIYNKDVCFGCRYCVIACPFHIPGYDYESAFDAKVVKCILCYPRIKEGKLPACAEACPGGALTFGKRADLLKLARRRIVENPDKYVDHIYGETEVGGTSWLYISGVPFEQLGFPMNLPKRPLIELTAGYTSTVPVIFTVFPAIFGLVYAATKKKDDGHSESQGEKEDKK